MAARATGWAMLVQRQRPGSQDLALIAHAATLEARVPFIHFFDGFRTSHEVMKIERADRRRSAGHDGRRPGPRPSRARAVARPSVIRGTAHNPDTFFQAREAGNPFYLTLPGHRPARDGPIRRADRPPVPPVRLRRRSGCRARDRHHGLGRGDREETARPERGGERSASSRCACTGRSPRTRLVAALPTSVERSPFSTGPRSRARPASRCTRTS